MSSVSGYLAIQLESGTLGTSGAPILQADDRSGEAGKKRIWGGIAATGVLFLLFTVLATLTAPGGGVGLNDDPAAAGLLALATNEKGIRVESLQQTENPCHTTRRGCDISNLCRWNFYLAACEHIPPAHEGITSEEPQEEGER